MKKMKKVLPLRGHHQRKNSLSEPYMYWIILYKTHLMDALLYSHCLDICQRYIVSNVFHWIQQRTVEFIQFWREKHNYYYIFMHPFCISSSNLVIMKANFFSVFDWYQPCAEFISGNIKSYFYFPSFLNPEMAHIVEICPCRRQRPVYRALSIPWLLMSWRHKEPGHQHSWY